MKTVSADREYIINKLKEVLRKEEEILFAYLYGSYAYDSILPESDIDVAVFLKPSDLKKYFEIEKRIISSLIDEVHSDRIDLRILNVLPLLHQYNVLKDGIPIFINDEQARVDFDTKVMIRFFELKPYLDEYRNMLFIRVQKGI